MIVDYLAIDSIAPNSDNKLPEKNTTVLKSIDSSLAKSDVQFFPEGGDLVFGISSRIGFKATGINGLGLPVNGVVVDQHQQEVNHFQTMHAGMGNFILKPDQGKDYMAIITFSDGSTRNIPLPKPVDNGSVMAVYQPNPDSPLSWRTLSSSPGVLQPL